jgi:hypothetical protein
VTPVTPSTSAAKPVTPTAPAPAQKKKSKAPIVSGGY